MQEIVLPNRLEAEIKSVIEELNKENEIIGAIQPNALSILGNKTPYYYAAKRLKKIADKLMRIDNYLSFSTYESSKRNT